MSASHQQTVWVIPCFNEAERLDTEQVIDLARSSRLLLVNDGSTDDTRHVIDTVVASAKSIQALHLDQNQGKAEAVRQGLLHAIGNKADWVGYLDADFATPSSEAHRLAALINGRYDVILGSRWRRLGTEIVRKRSRHYVGRFFATIASVGLGIPVYDTQCGAKLFRVTPALIAALSHPFRSGWAFDVELLGRLLDNGTTQGKILEEPLKIWHDVDGSKVKPLPALKSLAQMLRLTAQRRLKR